MSVTEYRDRFLQLARYAPASDTASTISPPGTRQLEWISLEKQGRRPRGQHVFLLLANTLLAPTRMNQVLLSGGRVLSSEELYLELMATTARMKIQAQQTLLKQEKQQNHGSPHDIQGQGGSRAKQKRFYSSIRHVNPRANSTPHCHLFRRFVAALMISERS